ncbi:hypothetical protein [Paracidovorax wautersii]|uniref:Fe-S oxidoreductase n=1 Tax=Paracidovorax wautersii TaxID=1177982 RepID=A0ABU1I976_9BURK|nr:hypothetical protein [Paracidovorax wautersii]MDR6213764.1 hypothetical protein [Paracidovorax wautersii]
MAAPIDPPRTPLPPVARMLAEAALQRQNMLLGTERAGGASAASAFPEVPLPPGTPLPLPAPALRPPLPVPADRVSLSEQGRAGLAGDAAGGGGGGARSGPPVLARLPGGAPGPGAAGQVAGTTAALWPASGVPAPLRQLLGALVQQLTQAGSPQRVVAAQPWQAGMQGVIDGTDPGQTLPALQTWLVGHGAVRTAEGERGLSLALLVPAAWAKALPPDGAAPGAQGPSAAAPLSAPFGGRPQALASGLFALVLQPRDPAGARTSALLALDMAPWVGSAAAAAYGRDLAQLRNDPWLHMTLQQASGQWREDEEAALRRGGSEPCHTVGCPYAGRAPCEQPFCMALRTQPSQGASAS